jgi:3-oxoacyl-[acyl-carrier-protein] synthase-1
MNEACIVGRGLACSLGLDLAECLANLRAGGRPASVRNLPGGMGGDFPYFAIPVADADWYGRARQLITRVAAEAGVQPGCRGALLLATSSFDIGAVEAGVDGATVGDYRAFLDRIAGWLDWAGPTYAVSTACTSSLNAMITGKAMLDAGVVGEVLVLGVELDNRMTPGGFAALQLLSRSGGKPFGADRDGLVLGESVAAVRLAARGPAAWRLLGGANVVDGSNPTGASEAALAAMYMQVLDGAGLRPADIDLVKVQAAGSPGNDAAEAGALRCTFASLPALVSLKAALGHTMGASGAAEIALLTACLEQGIWPSVAGVTDPELGVELAVAAPPVRRLLATILGFGGSHATVALERT